MTPRFADVVAFVEAWHGPPSRVDAARRCPCAEWWATGDCLSGGLEVVANPDGHVEVAALGAGHGGLVKTWQLSMDPHAHVLIALMMRAFIGRFEGQRVVALDVAYPEALRWLAAQGITLPLVGAS